MKKKCYFNLKIVLQNINLLKIYQLQRTLFCKKYIDSFIHVFIQLQSMRYLLCSLDPPNQGWFYGSYFIFTGCARKLARKKKFAEIWQELNTYIHESLHEFGWSLSVFLWVSNKRLNGWTDHAQTFVHTYITPKEGLWLVELKSINHATQLWFYNY